MEKERPRINTDYPERAPTARTQSDPDIMRLWHEKHRGHRVAAVDMPVASYQSASTNRTVRLSLPALRRQK